MCKRRRAQLCRKPKAIQTLRKLCCRYYASVQAQHGLNAAQEPSELRPRLRGEGGPGSRRSPPPRTSAAARAPWQRSLPGTCPTDPSVQTCQAAVTGYSHSAPTLLHLAARHAWCNYTQFLQPKLESRGGQREAPLGEGVSRKRQQPPRSVQEVSQIALSFACPRAGDHENPLQDQAAEAVTHRTDLEPALEAGRMGVSEPLPLLPSAHHFFQGNQALAPPALRLWEVAPSTRRQQ